MARTPVPLVTAASPEIDEDTRNRNRHAGRFSPRIGRPDAMQRHREQLTPEPDPVRDITDRPLVVDDLMDYWPQRVAPNTTLTPTIACAILNLIRGGSFHSTAARYSGVIPATLAGWMKSDGEPYRTFQRWVDIADAFSEHSALRVIRSSKDPKAALAYLSRRFPKHWAEERSTGNAPLLNLDMTGLLERVSTRLLTTAPGEIARVIEGEVTARARPTDPRRRQLASQTGHENGQAARGLLDVGGLKMPVVYEPGLAEDPPVVLDMLDEPGSDEPPVASPPESTPEP